MNSQLWKFSFFISSSPLVKEAYNPFILLLILSLNSSSFLLSLISKLWLLLWILYLVNFISSFFQFSSVQFSRSVMSNSLRYHESQHTGLPVHHQLLEFTQTHVHRVGDAIQESHPLTSPSPPAPNPSQHQSPFQWVNAWGGQSTGASALASFLPKNTQDWSLEWTGWISLQSKGLSRVFSNTTVQKHQFFSTQLSPQSNSHIHTWPLEKP